MPLLMIPAEDVERTPDVAEVAVDLVRAAQSLLGALRRLQRTTYGHLGWLTSYRWRPRLASSPRSSEALLIAASGATLHRVDTLMGDWRSDG